MSIAAADWWFLPVMAAISLIGLAGVVRGLIELRRQKKNQEQP